MRIPLSGNYMSGETGEILSEISSDEVECGRPMLSAVAVSVKGSPGLGFFALARELGLLKGESKEAKNQFWIDTRNEVYVTWKRDYSKYK